MRILCCINLKRKSCFWADLGWQCWNRCKWIALPIRFWAARKVLKRSRNACTQCWNAVFLSTFLRAHFYCIPALPHAEKDPRGAHYACISIAFLLFPSTFFRAHFYCVPALSACISIALQHSLHAFLLYPSTVFQHCMRAFLLYSSTFLVAFTHVCMCLYVFVPYTIYHIPYTVC